MAANPEFGTDYDKSDAYFGADAIEEYAETLDDEDAKPFWKALRKIRALIDEAPGD